MSDSDWAFLCDRMREGQVVLFLGAGFSLDAKSRTGQDLPTGADLAKSLAQSASFEIQDDPLPTVCEVVKKSLGSNKYNALMESRFDVGEYADWYNLLPTFAWPRIYSTNIDNLIQAVYRGSKLQRLRTIVCPASPEERDTLYDELQIIHLHGCINEPGKDMTFTFSELGKQTSQPNPWYNYFIEDIFNFPIIFVGTSLQDSPMYHYLEERGARAQGERESRPKSFLVSKTISEIRKAQLKGSNIIPIEATAADFFEALRSKLPANETTVDSVRKIIRPDLEITADKKVQPSVSVGRHFSLIRNDMLPPSPKHADPNQFFLGAEPDWCDLSDNRDAERDVTNQLVDVLSNDKPRAMILKGPAGCGKSTVAMRASIKLAAQGFPCWFATHAGRLDLQVLLDHVHNAETDRHHFIFIDTAMRHLDSIGESFARIKKSPIVTLILIDRTNTFARKQHSLDELSPIAIEVGNLTDSDIRNVLNRLEHFRMLGTLKGASADQRVQMFKQRSEKQLLVAMREATSGRGFDVILKGEYSELAPQAKLAYGICCLASSQGAPGVYKRHLMASMDRSGLSKSKVLDDLLKGVVVRANHSGTLLKPRHRTIGRWICTNAVDDEHKYEAIVRFLASVSTEIVPNEIKRRTPAYLGYRGLINSRGLWQLFGDKTYAPRIYESVKEHYSGDFLFWLHYGMVQLESGNFDIAENYLNQSIGIRKGNFQTMHQLGILHLRVACSCAQEEAELMLERANDGIRILSEQIHERGLKDAYPYAAYLKHVLTWYCHAYRIIPSEEWDSLKSIAQRARELYGNDDYIRRWADETNRLYMLRTVATANADMMRPEDIPLWEN